MRNNRCFLDTSALIALNDVKDQYHEKSRDIAASLKDSRLILSDAVVTETYSLLRYRSGFNIARYFLDTVVTDDSFMIVEITPSIRENTLQILDQYCEHKISYCDALSVAVMNEQQIETIFAFDYHFEMMGVRLVRI
ncbi:type II toxin-antitoxin system VapC family toxin [Lentibacillus sp. CBA3610]|uniref:type II toxin-antitoxin system VapC family toxin n=1 Tax=Lentibacillus sp. CBA3610 TaxID=2518176 RepID=UPI0015953501|nr:PIN domain-containing protein [Lentibacillus sp. CBA3610]